MTILPGLGQLNWAAFHRRQAIAFASAGDRDRAFIEKRKAEGCVWWSKNQREEAVARIQFRKELQEAA